MVIEELAKYAKMKGLDILGTGDFTHPQWLKELKQKLEEKERRLLEKEQVKEEKNG
jgi:PHP family Zn ribbon phosphoesterase